MIRFIIAACLLFGGVPAYSADSAAAKIIVLDSGHIPPFPGAQGACGGKEVQYNDAMTGRIAAGLSALPGVQVRLTRQAGRSVITADDRLPPQSDGRESVESLRARIAFANQQGAAFFISIHHDSTEDRYLVKDPSACDGRGGMRLTPEFKAAHRVGYNIFVSQGDESNQARFQESVKLAAAIGRRMQAAGLTASDYHIAPVENCRSCRPIDQTNGVWNQDLAVLKNTTIPAILIECQNIADPDFQKIADSPDFQARVAKAVVDGTSDFQTGRNRPIRRSHLKIRAPLPASEDAAGRILAQ